MSHNYSQSHPPQIAEDALEVSSHIIGRSLIDALRSFTTRGQKERGDYLMDQSRELLQKHFELIAPHFQQIVQDYYARARHVKEHLENDSGPQFQRFLKAMKYQRVSKQAYKIIKRASDKAINDDLMAQIARAMHGPGVEPGNGFGPGSTHSDPISGLQAMSRLTTVPVNDLQEVTMTTYATEATGEAAVVLDLHSQDASTRHLVATFSTALFSANATDRDGQINESYVQAPTGPPPISGSMSLSEAPGVATTLSIHQNDGSSPQLVITSLPIPYHSRGRWRTREAETDTVSSSSTSEVFKLEA